MRIGDAEIDVAMWVKRDEEREKKSKNKIYFEFQ